MSSIAQQKARAAAAHEIITNPDTHFVGNQTLYNVGLGTAPSWLKFDTPTRYGVKINTGHAALGSAPIRITFQYRTYGNIDDWGTSTYRILRVGIRKIADDSQVLIGEHPIQFEALKAGTIQTVTVQGGNDYLLVGGDHVTFEMDANANSGIELPVSTTEAFPANTVSQVYTGSRANTSGNRPLAVSITSRVLTPI
jgi:hypothetical protein